MVQLVTILFSGRKASLSYRANTLAADGLGMQGMGALAAIILIHINSSRIFQLQHQNGSRIFSLIW